eukprot:3533154-Pleurochrysis_carterae.AAC.1
MAITAERRSGVRSTNESCCATRGETQEWCEGGLGGCTGIDELHRSNGDGGAEGCNVEHHGEKGAEFEATRVL